MSKITDPVHLRARASLIGQEAARWKAHHAEAFAKLPEGTTVFIDIVTGDYVTGTTWFLALDAFEQKFGTDERFSHSFTVGRPIFLSGGLWSR
jgi:hypothetical protein